MFNIRVITQINGGVNSLNIKPVNNKSQQLRPRLQQKIDPLSDIDKQLVQQIAQLAVNDILSGTQDELNELLAIGIYSSNGSSK